MHIHLFIYNYIYIYIFVYNHIHIYIHIDGQLQGRVRVQSNFHQYALRGKTAHEPASFLSSPPPYLNRHVVSSLINLSLLWYVTFWLSHV